MAEFQAAKLPFTAGASSSVAPQSQDLDPVTTVGKQLRSLLQRSYDMPTKEWWVGAERRFQLLRRYFEKDSPDVENMNAKDGRHASKSKTLRRKKTRHPRVKVLKACTFLVGVPSVAEPLVCKAFGTIAPQRYEEVFWETAAKLKDEEEVKLEVISIGFPTSQEVIFFFRLDGYEFKLRYLQWGTLVLTCDDIPNSPPSFTSDFQGPKTDRLFLRNLQDDERRRRNLDKEDHILAYYYIRAWAIERGLYRRKHVEGDGRTVSPARILDALTQIAKDVSPQSALSISTILSEFFENFSGTFKSSLDVRLLSCYCPRVKDKVCKWDSLLLKLGELSIARKMECFIYVRVAVVFAGSEIAGSLWLRDIVEPSIRELSEAIQAAFENSAIAIPWQYRLTRKHASTFSDQPHGNEPYEGFYIIGVNHSSESISEDVVRRVAQAWEVRIQNRTEKIEGEGNDIRILTAAVLSTDEVLFESYIRCLKTWPYKLLEAPHDSRHDSAFVKSCPKDQHRIAHNEQVPNGFLCPAREIFKRIKGDQRNFKVDEWVVGYRDRHMLTIQEKPVSEWQLDSSHESWIPEHRIEYFKHVTEDGNETIKWNKGTKVDLISKNPDRDAAQEPESEELTLTKRQRQQVAREEWNKRFDDASESENDEEVLQGLQDVDADALRKLKATGRLKGMTKRQTTAQQAAVALEILKQEKEREDALKLKRQGKKNKQRVA